MDRIDTHHHIVPAFYRDWLEKAGRTGGGLPIPQWSLDGALSFMDAHDIATAILSVAAPGAYVGNAIEARGMARALNAETAQTVANNPARFGFFATLCLPDVAASIEEARRAFDELKADGVC
jgi:predicted TIM-barrel fold metal-dependent hydrolase